MCVHLACASFHHHCFSIEQKRTGVAHQASCSAMKMAASALVGSSAVWYCFLIRRGPAMSQKAFLEAAKVEEARLASELERVPAYIRLMAVRQLISTYDTQPAAALSSTSDQTEASLHAKRGRSSTRAGSVASTVITEAASFLKQRGSRAQTLEILAALKQRGLSFSSKNPAGSVSSALSHNALFDNVRGEGYGLVEWQNGDQIEPAQDASAGPPDGPVLSLAQMLE